MKTLICRNTSVLDSGKLYAIVNIHLEIQQTWHIVSKVSLILPKKYPDVSSLKYSFTIVIFEHFLVFELLLMIENRK